MSRGTLNQGADPLWLVGSASPSQSPAAKGDSPVCPTQGKKIFPNLMCGWTTLRRSTPWRPLSQWDARLSSPENRARFALSCSPWRSRPLRSSLTEGGRANDRRTFIVFLSMEIIPQRQYRDLPRRSRGSFKAEKIPCRDPFFCLADRKTSMV